MSSRKEKRMLRFVLYVILFWLISYILKVVFKTLSLPRQQQQRRDGVGRQSEKPPAVDFKDVQDAEFKDITEKEPK
jgi:hypothetical protein